MSLAPADRLELTELVARYAAAVDSREWDRVGSLFCVDGVLIAPDPPGSLRPTHPHRGPAAIADAMRRLESFALTFHHVTGVVIDDADGESVRGRATAIAHHVETDPPHSWVWHLVYDDWFTRTPNGWRFESRALTIRLIESRPIARVEP